MARTKNGTKQSLLDTVLDEASWLITHADSLSCHGRKKEAQAEWLRAATCEEQVACLLETEGQDLEAAIHRVSAASCFAKAERYADAVTLVRSALSFSIQEDNRLEIEGYRKEWLAKAKKQLRRDLRKQTASV
jgi:hypothetical protein